MTSTSITKKAYARGIGEALQRQGRIQFPNNETLKTAADHAAQLIEAEPSQDYISDGECMKVANYLAQVNDGLRQRGKTASWPQSVSLAVDGRTAFGDLIQKVAAEVAGQPGGQAPTAVGMGDHSNDLTAAAGVSDLGAKEQRERPDNYAYVGQGNANLSESESARHGVEQDHPQKPKSVGGASGNSVTQASKSASIQSLIQKLAEGQPGGHTSTAVGTADHRNDLNAAAGESDLGAKEQGERPDAYAHAGQGNVNIGESSNARIGEEQPHPKQPADVLGENSVTRASKVAAARHAGRQSVDTLLQGLSRNFG